MVRPPRCAAFHSQLQRYRGCLYSGATSADLLVPAELNKWCGCGWIMASDDFCFPRGTWSVVVVSNRIEPTAKQALAVEAATSGLVRDCDFLIGASGTSRHFLAGLDSGLGNPYRSDNLFDRRLRGYELRTDRYLGLVDAAIVQDAGANLSTVH